MYIRIMCANCEVGVIGVEFLTHSDDWTHYDARETDRTCNCKVKPLTNALETIKRALEAGKFLTGRTATVPECRHYAPDQYREFLTVQTNQEA